MNGTSSSQNELSNSNNNDKNDIRKGENFKSINEVNENIK